MEMVVEGSQGEAGRTWGAEWQDRVGKHTRQFENLYLIPTLVENPDYTPGIQFFRLTRHLKWINTNLSPRSRTRGQLDSQSNSKAQCQMFKALVWSACPISHVAPCCIREGLVNKRSTCLDAEGELIESSLRQPDRKQAAPQECLWGVCI